MYKQLDKLLWAKPKVDNSANEWNDCHNLGERGTSGQSPGILLNILKFSIAPILKNNLDQSIRSTKVVKYWSKLKIKPHHTTPHHTTPHYTIPHHTTVHYTTAHHTHHTTPYHTILHPGCGNLSRNIMRLTLSLPWIQARGPKEALLSFIHSSFIHSIFKKNVY